MNRPAIRIDSLVVARRTFFSFRHDADVVRFLNAAYGRMSVSRCFAEGRRRFKQRAPSRSSIGRYWKWLDEQVGLEVA